MDLYKVTSLLVNNTLEETSIILEVDKKEIIKFLEENGLIYHKGKVITLNEVEIVETQIELKPPRVENVKRRTLGMDKDTMDKWDQFTKKHSKYQIYELLTLALNEFMDKYK